MNTSTSLYKRHRFTSEIIQYAVWLYHRFNMSHRDIEDLLAERGLKLVMSPFVCGVISLVLTLPAN